MSSVVIALLGATTVRSVFLFFFTLLVLEQLGFPVGYLSPSYTSYILFNSI